jgi:hypothetical protein
MAAKKQGKAQERIFSAQVNPSGIQSGAGELRNYNESPRAHQFNQIKELQM